MHHQLLWHGPEISQFESPGFKQNFTLPSFYNTLQTNPELQLLSPLPHYPRSPFWSCCLPSWLPCPFTALCPSVPRPCDPSTLLSGQIQDQFNMSVFSALTTGYFEKKAHRLLSLETYSCPSQLGLSVTHWSYYLSLANSFCPFGPIALPRKYKRSVG